MSDFFKSNWLKPLIIVLILGAALAAAYHSGINRDMLVELFTDIESDPVGYIPLYLLIFVGVTLTAVVPASAVGLIGGMIFGLFGGFFLSILGLLIAASVGFFTVRSLLGDGAIAVLKRRLPLSRLETAFDQYGSKAVLMLRLFPAASFGLMTYALAMTNVRFVPFLVGTIGSLPALLCYVLLGTTTRAGFDAVLSGSVERPSWLLGLMGVLAVLSILLSMRVLKKPAD